MTKLGIARRLKRLAKQLALDHWNFELIVEESDLRDAAGCEAKPEYFDARIFVNVAKVTDAEIDEYLVHELLHCHVWELTHLAEKLATTDTEREAIRMAEERLTTQLERLLAPRLT